MPSQTIQWFPGHMAKTRRMIAENLKLVDSYIEGTYTGEVSRAGVGSIVGYNKGTVTAVYSSATVKNAKSMTGGIAGMSEGGKISNCWFDGEIHGDRATGGILGGAYAQDATIEHCLNTGTFTVADNSYYVGGICGELQNAATGHNGNGGCRLYCRRALHGKQPEEQNTQYPEQHMHPEIPINTQE